MLRITDLSNVFQKRTIRPLYAHTQATPFAGYLDPRLRNTDGSVRVPLNADTPANSGLTRTANAFSFQGGLVAGTVMVNTAGEGFVPANGAATAAPNTVTPFGLLANFVGGKMDDLKDNNEIGVWRGAYHAFFELLYPAFNDAGMAAAYTTQTGLAAESGAKPLLYAGVDGRLCVLNSGTGTGGIGASAANMVPVARLLNRLSAGVIHIELLV